MPALKFIGWGNSVTGDFDSSSIPLIKAHCGNQLILSLEECHKCQSDKMLSIGILDAKDKALLEIDPAFEAHVMEHKTRLYLCEKCGFWKFSD